MTNYSKMTLAQLQELAAIRYGSRSGAFMIASSYGDSTYRKAPWIKALERPMDVQDLARLADHENWAKGIREQIKKGGDR